MNDEAQAIREAMRIFRMIAEIEEHGIPIVEPIDDDLQPSLDALEEMIERMK